MPGPFGLLMLSIDVAAVSCGLGAPDWQEATSATGECGTAPQPLDGAVDRSIEGGRALEESKSVGTLKSRPALSPAALPQRLLEIGDQVVGVLDAQ